MYGVGAILQDRNVWCIELGAAWSLQGSKGGSLSAEGGPLAAPGVAPSLVLLREFSNAVDRTGAWLPSGICMFTHQTRHAVLCDRLRRCIEGSAAWPSWSPLERIKLQTGRGGRCL